MYTVDDEQRSIRKIMRFLLGLDNQGLFETPTVDPASLG
jgi:hypothetical protein